MFKFDYGSPDVQKSYMVIGAMELFQTTRSQLELEFSRLACCHTQYQHLPLRHVHRLEGIGIASRLLITFWCIRILTNTY